MKYFIFFIFLFGLVFVYAQELDSLKITLLGKKELCYPTNDKLILPTMSNESNKLIPSDKKWSLSIGYSPAICIRGDDLIHETGPGQVISFDPFRNFYILNAFTFDFGYRINPQWIIGIGPKWFLGSMSKTSKITAMIESSDDPYEEPWIHRNLYWEISVTVLSISIQHTFPNCTYLKIGPEFYSSAGKDHEKAYRWDHELQHDVEQFVNASNNGRGFGFIAQAGHMWEITSNFMWDLSFGIRIGKSWEYSYSVQENIIWSGPVDFSFSGLFLNFGVSYMLF